MYPVGMGLNMLPRYIREIIQEVSSVVMGTGESGESNFGCVGEGQPIALPAIITAIVAEKILSIHF
jgi:hypothetical protein